MKQLFLTTLVSILLSYGLFGQTYYQTIRGSITDQDSNTPLIGATIIVLNSDPLIGSISDVHGDFRLQQVPIGRVSLKVTYVGYEDRIIPNLLIGSAKEEILSITLKESVNKLEEIVIKANDVRGEALNEMAVISAHTFSVEETQRYAGSFDDPARMVVAFAGVNGNAEGNNDIIVRGNSPKGILWRLEGITIPNPNHFAGEGSTGGPINALSSKMLSNSDFFTGAFSAEYGDVTSGVFDMKLKNGNNEQHEYTAAISTLGLDITAEGPFSKGNGASYIANYRYSTLDLLDRAGVVDFGGVPKYQDLSFKVRVPINAHHYLSLFGLGGMSGIDSEDKDEQNEDVVVGRFSGRDKLGVFGLMHTYQLNSDMYLKTSLASTSTQNNYSYAMPSDNDQFYTVEQGDINRSSLIGTTAFNYKINAKHKIETGVIFTRLHFNMQAYDYNFESDVLENVLSQSGNASTIQVFTNWKYRVTDNITMINGLHYLTFTLNNNYSIEPRTALQWQLNESQSFNMGVGLHSKLEGVSTYLAKQFNDNGSYTQPNKNLDITRAAHFILGYNRRLGNYTNLKVEAYYQHLYNVPVEDSDTSSYSLLNVTEGYTNRYLVNEGKGKNYGVEFTLERYFNKGLYYMTTLSLFRSLYTPKDGIERASAFDNQYVTNFIGGKEFKVGNVNKNKVFFINTKVALIGGKRYSPIDIEASNRLGAGVVDEHEPFTKKSDDIFRTDLSFGLRRNRKNITTEFKFDVQNILNNQVVIDEYYIPATGSIYKSRQLGMLPTISFKVSF